MTFEEKILHIFRIRMALGFGINGSEFFQDNKKEIIQIYKDVFTEDEIDEIVSFYLSDIVKKIPELTKKLTALIESRNN